MPDTARVTLSPSLDQWDLIIDALDGDEVAAQDASDLAVLLRNALDRMVPGTYGGCEDLSPVEDDEAALFPPAPVPSAAEAQAAVMQAALRRLALDEPMTEMRPVESDESPARHMLSAELNARLAYAAGTLETIGRLADEAPDGEIRESRNGNPVSPEPEPEPPFTLAQGGYFAKILFFGHIEHVGYVTEVTGHGGVAAYHVDLPDKVWGGNPLAEVEYAASSYFGKQRLSEKSVKDAWEAERKRAERLRLEREEWERRAAERALLATVPADPDDDPDGYIAHAVGCQNPEFCDGECMEGSAS